MKRRRVCFTVAASNKESKKQVVKSQRVKVVWTSREEKRVVYGAYWSTASRWRHRAQLLAEDMTTSRQAFRVDPQHPGSDRATETAPLHIPGPL
uniref:Endoglucanase n=1 Tax=Oryza barthii TaxID=65489 RepID=A0A0D3G4H1_9ORYZ